jgi:alpha-beta hydrolase superfamily lysophospholipase
MHRSPPSRRPLGYLLVPALLSLPGLTGPARAADSEKAKFETTDHVELQGTFYPGKKGKRSPAVLLIHGLGSNSQQEGWVKLAEALADKDYAVLSFDLRGYGASTSVDKDFWRLPINQSGFKAPARNKETISHKDFLPVYVPWLVNDIAAAKAFLDRKNDSGDCNSSSLILVGADEGATLGAMWMAAEQHRYRVTSSFPSLEWDRTSEGKNVYAAVWLTLSPNLGNRGVLTALDSWLRLAGKDKKIPMAFVYGSDDSRGEANAARFLQVIKGFDKNALPLTNKYGIKTKLTGDGLLNKGLSTTNWIVKTYLSAVGDKNAPNEWVKQDADLNGYVWVFRGGAAVMAKREKDRVPNPIPLGALGIGP